MGYANLRHITPGGPNWPEMGPACGIRPAAELRSWGSTRAQPGCVRSKKNTHRHHAHRRMLHVREQKVEPNCALPVPEPGLFHGASKPVFFFLFKPQLSSVLGGLNMGRFDWNPKPSKVFCLGPSPTCRAFLYGAAPSLKRAAGRATVANSGVVRVFAAARVRIMLQRQISQELLPPWPIVPCQGVQVTKNRAGT